jgi:1-acyl-sn-glycerol-3-phosphate acyltransferase
LIILRKTIITLWFWIWVSISTLITGSLATFFILSKYLFESQNIHLINLTDHDLITLTIEGLMAPIIQYAMTIPKIWKVEYYMPEHSQFKDIEDKTFILASNHSSIIDTLFMATLPFKKTYTYNAKWGRVPVFGWMCIWAEYIGIDTNSETARAKVVERTIAKVKQGYSVMIYPEGGRTHDPYNLPEKLKTGTFRIANEANVPVLPIVFNGMFRAVDRYGVADIANIEIVVMDPIKMTDDMNSNIKLFRTAILQHLQKK